MNKKFILIKLPESSSKIKIVIFLISSFVFSFSCIKYSYAVELQGYINYEQHSTMEECDNLKVEWQKCLNPPGCDSYHMEHDPYREMELCYFQMAVKDNNTNICMEKFNQDESIAKMECVKQVAIANKNVDLCEKTDEIIVNPDSSSTRNILIPDSTRQTEKNRCYTELSVKTGDINICGKIITEDPKNYKDNCYIEGLNYSRVNHIDIIPKNPNICQKMPDYNDPRLPGYHREQCYVYALSELMNESMKDFLAKNVSVCEQFSSPTDRSICYKKAFEFLMRPEFSEYLMNNPGICENFIEPNKEKCYQTALSDLVTFQNGAYLAKNADLCSSYKDNNQTQCYHKSFENINMKNLGNVYCEKFPEENKNSSLFATVFNRIIGRFGTTDNLLSKEKCYYDLGIFPKGEQNKYFTKKIISALVVLLLEFMSGIILFILMTKRQKRIYRYILFGYLVLMVVVSLIMLERRIWIDVKYYYTISFDFLIIYFITAAIWILLNISKATVAKDQNNNLLNE